MNSENNKYCNSIYRDRDSTFLGDFGLDFS